MRNFSSQFGLIVLLAVYADLASSESISELAIASDPAIVEVETRQGAREFIQLPTLTFNLDIAQQCQEEREPVNLSISVADTRRTLSADKLAESATIIMPLSVPAAQIAPVAIAGFCVADSDENSSAREELLSIGDVLSLQASLLCRDESGTQIHYASVALDVDLLCTSADADTDQATDL